MSQNNYFLKFPTKIYKKNGFHTIGGMVYIVQNHIPIGIFFNSGGTLVSYFQIIIN
jgi:hypothetical protein